MNIRDSQQQNLKGRNKICVLGTRGFPGVQGGIEAHCEKLYPKIAELGYEITVFTRKPYVNPKINIYKNVKLNSVDCPKSKSLEAIVHTFKGLLIAKKIHPDLVHFHAVGPSLLIPLARILGMKVVMTNHGPDYERKKWNKFAKFVLKMGERLGSRFANSIICISKTIAENIKKKYNTNSHIIPNGVEIPEILVSDNILKKYSLTKSKYILTVGRFVPEKGFIDLIDAYNMADLNNWKLVIIGRADHKSEYSRRIEEKAKQRSNIVLTGFLSGQALYELYSHAGLFVLPSYYEGLPIVLLEAMSYGLLCLASDIEANRYVSLPEENYFPPGDIELLSKKLQNFIKKSHSDIQRTEQIEKLHQNYNWDDIAKKTIEVYEKVIQGLA